MVDAERHRDDASPVIAGALQFLRSLADDVRVDDQTRSRASRLRTEIVALSDEHRLRLAVVGEFSSGKSTFINALLGEDLLASDIQPTTAVATRLTWGPAFQVEVRPPGAPATTLWPTVPVDRSSIGALASRHAPSSQGFLTAGGALRPASRPQVAEFIRLATTEQAGATALDEVVIRLPSPYLAAAIDLIDTPGFNPGLDADDRARHLAVTRRCIESSHLALFIIDARNPLKASERDQVEACGPFLSRIFFVANKMDLLDEEEAADLQDYLHTDLPKKFGLSSETPSAYFVSSHPAGGAFRQNLAQLREDVVAFMQAERSAITLERTARILASEAESLSTHARTVAETYRGRLEQLHALRVGDADAMRRAVLEHARSAYAEAAGDQWQSFPSTIENRSGMAARTFWNELSRVSERDKVREKAIELADPTYQRSFWTPLREHLVTCLATTMERALNGMHREFSSRFATANVAQPKGPDLQVIRRLAEGLVTSESAAAGVGGSIAQAERAGNIAKGVGAAAGVALGLMSGVGAAVIPLARAGASFLGAVFGASIDELKQRAQDGFEQQLDAGASSVADVAHRCLVGEHPEILGFVGRCIDEQISVYAREVARLHAEHEAKKRVVESSIKALEDAAREARGWASKAAERHQVLRDALAHRRDFGRPRLTPVLDETVAACSANEAFGAALQGAVDVPDQVARWLAGDGAIVRGAISPESLLGIRKASAAVGLSNSVASRTSARWVAEHPQDLPLLDLDPLDLGILSDDSGDVVVDTASALLAASRPRADLAAIVDALNLTRLVTRSETRRAAMADDTQGVGRALELARARTLVEDRFRTWQLPAPETLALGEERLRAELDRRARRTRIWRNARTVGITAALVATFSIVGIGFVKGGSVPSESPHVEAALASERSVELQAPTAPTPAALPPSEPAGEARAPTPPTDAPTTGSAQIASFASGATDAGQIVAAPVLPAGPDPIGTSAPTAEPPTPSSASDDGPLERLVPDSVSASSFVRTRHHRYPPENAFDGDPATAWNESGHGPGMGEWLQATFDRPHRIQRIWMSTGWDFQSQNHGDLFAGNSHLRRVRLELGGQTVVRDVAFDERAIAVEGLDVVASSVRIVADQVWPGTRWSDLCLGDVTIEGREEVPRHQRSRHRSEHGRHAHDLGPEPAARSVAPDAEDGAAPDSALAAARDCLRRRDNQCAITALAGQARSPESLAVLASAYRTAGQTTDAIRVMRRYIARRHHGALTDMFLQYIRENEP